MKLRIQPQVAEALSQNRAVVALESTVITHGLPQPQNLELAQSLEAVIREQGAFPATVAILKGEIVIGLEPAEMTHLATRQAAKASLWNLAAICAKQEDAGTTVATTLHAASLAGIKVFATGGIGGVHDEPFDESADLQALASHPLITVCAGPKSILNVKATLERLESLGVPVIGYKNDYLAGFHLQTSPYRVPVRADSSLEIKKIYQMQSALGLKQGLLISNPVSEGIDEQELKNWLMEAHRQAQKQGLIGKDTTPFLLAKLAELSKGETVTVNLKLLRENARLAAQIALDLAATPEV
ncbi:MAG: pseudouridine-5'-phosphate glycosidase [Trueperaceae bacterium]|nr:pseudouridine-5'-phosphate glycosidase [Trueperaceae bacterium]